MRKGQFDREIAHLARRQHGVFSRGQALQLGGERSSIDRRRRNGDWITLEAGVYGLPSASPTWERQLMAATLAVPSGVVGGRSAAALHGVGRFRRLRPELWIPHHCRAVTSLATTRRTRHLEPIDRTSIRNIRVATLERTVIGLAERLDCRALGRLVDDAYLERRLDLDRLVERTAAILQAGRPTRLLMEHVLEERLESGYVPPASELEARLLEVLVAGGLPPPVRQLVMPWRDAQPLRVDAAYPDYHLIIEADGRRWHTRLQDFENDHNRDLLAFAHGYTVVRVTWRRLAEDADGVVVAIQAWIDGRAA